MKDKFKVKLSPVEISLVEALIPYLIHQGNGGMKRAEIVTRIEGCLGFPLSPRYVKEKLAEAQTLGSIGFEEGKWFLTLFWLRTFKHQLNVDYIISIEKQCAVEIESHKKAYLQWKYEQELKQARMEALSKVAQLPENMNMMVSLRRYLARHKSWDEFPYTTPEAERIVIEEQCWMVNPAGFILKPDPRNPLSWTMDDQSHVEGFMSNDDFWNLKRLTQRPTVKMWKKILPEAPVFYLPAVYAVQHMMANPLRPMCMENTTAAWGYVYMRWNPEYKHLELRGLNDLENWSIYSPSSGFFTYLFRDCTVTELSKYYPGYEPQDDASDDY